MAKKKSSKKNSDELTDGITLKKIPVSREKLAMGDVVRRGKIPFQLNRKTVIYIRPCKLQSYIDKYGKYDDRL